MPHEHPDCPVVCADLIRAQTDIDAIGKEMRRMRAVLFGTSDDQTGGLLHDMQQIKTWLKALTLFIGALLLLFGPERIAQVVKYMK